MRGQCRLGFNGLGDGHMPFGPDDWVGCVGFSWVWDNRPGVCGLGGWEGWHASAVKLENRPGHGV